jgi:hypothetical protein
MSAVSKLTKQTKEILNKLYLRVHPDLFIGTKQSRIQNQNSLSDLNNFTTTLFKYTGDIKPTTVNFHIGNSCIKYTIGYYTSELKLPVSPILCSPLLLTKLNRNDKKLVKFLLAIRSLNSLASLAGITLNTDRIQELETLLRKTMNVHSNHKKAETIHPNSKFPYLFHQSLINMKKSASLPFFFDADLPSLNRMLAVQKYQFVNMPDLYETPIMFSLSYKVKKGVLVVPWDFEENEAREYIKKNLDRVIKELDG